MKHLSSKLLCATLTALLLGSLTFGLVKSAHAQPTTKAGLEVAFSPKGGAQELVIRVIDSARDKIILMGYSMTSAPVVSSLIKARKRGVQVAVVVDHKNNVSSKYGKAALGALTNAGIPVRTVRVFSIHHDKVIIVDDKTVQTGSFNYSAAAEKSNSENVLVVWNNPSLAKAYTLHFDRNWRLGALYKTTY